MRGGRARRAQRTASCVESPDSEVAGQNGQNHNSSSSSGDTPSEIALERQREGDISEMPEEAMPQQPVRPEDSSTSNKATNKKRSSDAVTTAAKRKKQNAGSSSIRNNGAPSSAKAKKKRLGPESESEAEADLDLNASGRKPIDGKDDALPTPPSDESDESAARNRAGRGSTKRKGASTQNVCRRGSSRARAPVNYVPEAMDGDEMEEDDDGGGEEEDEDEEEAKDRASSKGGSKAKKGKARKGSAAAKKGKRKDSSESRDSNPLLMQFDFQPISAEDQQGSVDWSTKAVPSSNPKQRSKEAKRNTSKAAKKRSNPDGGASTGTPLKDRSQRRSERSRGGVSLSYAEPGSDSSDADLARAGGEGMEDAENGAGEDESEDSDEEDNFEIKTNKRKPPASSGKRSTKGSASGRKAGGAKGGRGAKGGKAATAAAKAPPKKPPTATRRSRREKPPVDYDEKAMLQEVEELEIVDVDAEMEDADRSAESGKSQDNSDEDGDDDEDLVVKQKKAGPSSKAAKKPSAKKGKPTSKAAAAAAAGATKKKKGTKHQRTVVSCSSGEGEEEEEDGGEGAEVEYVEDDSENEEADSVANAFASRSRRAGGGGRGKGKGKKGKKVVVRGSEESGDSAVATPSEDDEDDEYSESDDEYSEEERSQPLRVQKILARRQHTRAEWWEMCKDMNTDQITLGSMWYQEADADPSDTKPIEKFMVKWNGMSYLHVSWETMSDLIELANPAVKMQIRKFREKEYGIELELERGDGEFFDPTLAQLDRVLDVDEVEGEDTRLLVKWLGGPYSACTYELCKDLDNAGQEYTGAVEAYHLREDMGPLLKMKAKRRKSDGAPDLDKEPPVFKNGGALRDYQREGVRWMVYNWLQGRGSILADEMGLGKTLQTVTFISILRSDYGVPGPFLVIAPLSTITHWQREFQNWSDMNTVVFHGDSDDREILEGYEMEFAADKDRKEKDKTKLNGRRVWKSTIVITTPELCIRRDVATLLGRKMKWDLLVVDEAHRLKNNDSKLNVALNDSFTFDSTLLLTGTPLQNSTEELWTLLNLVDRGKFNDKYGFVKAYGDLQQAEDVSTLQQNIKPYLLRRMKEDVEKAVPPKEETIIEVELTKIQKQYYRAIYEQNTTFLLQGKTRAQDGPSLMNLAMELRKCCNHPYLITGVEEAVRAQMGDSDEDKDHLVKYSGKLVLLDKLLPRLKEQGHRVLLFSQFKIMLNILEDYLIASGISYGRIDGSIQGPRRQKAIDNFQAPGSETVVMLLSTKAGGVGITLTAADTCIIYDSDWNPQNDIQAQARCHRIGQTKSVKVYRLLVAKTYEMHMFKTASKKLGLDQAVLAGTRPQGKGADKSGPTKAEVEKLLKHGAYDVFKEGKEGEEAGKRFCEDSIDAILSRALVVNHTVDGPEEGKPSNSFSKASFVATNTEKEDAVDVTDPEFWTKCVGLTVPVEKEVKLGRRAARAGKKEYKAASESEGGTDDDDYVINSEFEDVSSGEESMRLNDKHLWSHTDIAELLRSMLQFGYGRWEQIRDEAGVAERSISDVAAVCRAMMAVMMQSEAIAIAQASLRRDREAAIAARVVYNNNQATLRLVKSAQEKKDQEEAKQQPQAQAQAQAQSQEGNGGGAGGALTAAATSDAPKPAAVGGGGSTVGALVSSVPNASPSQVDAAAAMVPKPSEKQVQATVRRSLNMMIMKYQTARKALDDMKRVLSGKAKLKGGISGDVGKGEAAVAMKEIKDSSKPATAPTASKPTTAITAQTTGGTTTTKTTAPAVVDLAATTPAPAQASPTQAQAAPVQEAPVQAQPAPVAAAQAAAQAAAPPSGGEGSSSGTAAKEEDAPAASIAPGAAEAGAGAGAGAAGSKAPAGDGDKGGSSDGGAKDGAQGGKEGREKAVEEETKGAVVEGKAEVAETALPAPLPAVLDGSIVPGSVASKSAVPTSVGPKSVAPGSEGAGSGGPKSVGPGSEGAGSEGPKSEASKSVGAGSIVPKSGVTKSAAPGGTSSHVPADDKMDGPMYILNQTWKPRHVGPGSKFRANLGRIGAKLSVLDEIDDLGAMLHSPSPPFGRLALGGILGWGKEHDRWLAQSAYDMGWFTSTQKRKATKVLEDPSNTWPGLISKPDPATIGRRLRALVVKFRDEKRVAARTAAMSAERQKEERLLSEMKERRRQAYEESSAKIAKERGEYIAKMKKNQMERAKKEHVAKLAREAAAASSMAAAQERAKKAGVEQRHAEHAGGAGTKRPQYPPDAMLMEQERAQKMAVLHGAGAASGGGCGKVGHRNLRNGETSVGAVIAAGKGNLAHKVGHQEPRPYFGRGGGGGGGGVSGGIVVTSLPDGVAAGDPNVVTVYEADGRLKGYRVWPSEAAMLASPGRHVNIAPAVRPEDRIKGMAGIVMAANNGHGGGVDSSGGGRMDVGHPGYISRMQTQMSGIPAAHGCGGGGGSSVVIPTIPFLSNGGAVGAGGAGARGPQLQGTMAMAPGRMNGSPVGGGAGGGGGGRGGAGAGARSVMPTMFLSTSEAAAASEDGIMLRHAIHNLGVPTSLLLNGGVTTATAQGAAAKQAPLRRVLDMSWLKLANGNDLSKKGSESIGVHLLSKAAAIANDNFGLRLPKAVLSGRISEGEKDALIALLKSAAKATHLRANLIAFSELKQIQSFAGGLAHDKDLRMQSMPTWWKPGVHDAHLLIASCIYGSSSDYGVQKALKETTVSMLEAHGVTTTQETEVVGPASSSPSSPSSSAALGCCRTAELMSPLSTMQPPLTAATAKTRIKALHTSVFKQSMRVYAQAFGLSSLSQRVSVGAEGGGAAGASSGNTSGGNMSGSDECVIMAPGGGRPVARDSGSSPATKFAVGGSDAGDRGGIRGGAAKRPSPEVVVLDLCDDDDEEDEGEGGKAAAVPESALKKPKIEKAAPSSPPRAAAVAVAVAPADGAVASPSGGATAAAAASPTDVAPTASPADGAKTAPTDAPASPADAAADAPTDAAAATAAPANGGGAAAAASAADGGAAASLADCATAAPTDAPTTAPANGGEAASPVAAAVAALAGDSTIPGSSSPVTTAVGSGTNPPDSDAEPRVQEAGAAAAGSPSTVASATAAVSDCKGEEKGPAAASAAAADAAPSASVPSVVGNCSNSSSSSPDSGAMPRGQAAETVVGAVGSPSSSQPPPPPAKGGGGGGSVSDGAIDVGGDDAKKTTTPKKARKMGGTLDSFWSSP